MRWLGRKRNRAKCFRYKTGEVVFKRKKKNQEEAKMDVIQITDVGVLFGKR